MSRGTRVLLVARPDVAAERAEALETAGFSVAATESAASALRRLASTPPDCVVTARDLPDGDGLEVVERVRETAPALPVVFAPERGSEALAGDAVAAGVDQYVPADADDLATLHVERVADALETASEAGRPPAEDCLDDPAAGDEREPPAGYRTLVDTVGDAMYVLDADGVLCTVNDAMAAHLGYPREELLGEHAGAFMPEEDVRRGTEAIQALLEDDDRQWATFEMRSLPADGEPVQNETKVAALTDEDGRFVGSVGVVRDITERKRYERELEHQNERLDRFASVVSHDLRNPLTVAEGHLAELRKVLAGGSPADAEDGPVAGAEAGPVADAGAGSVDAEPATATDASAAVSDHLEELAWAHERMRTLVDDLLVLAREGKAVDDVEPVALADVAREAWATVATDAASLTVETEATVPADRGRLRQLFSNLFANAVEHTGGTVAVTVVDLSDGDGFAVADDGPGIPPAEREAVLADGYTTTDEGTGLGLSIVREVAEAHGWSVAVGESRDGGARFEVRGVDRCGSDRSGTPADAGDA